MDESLKAALVQPDIEDVLLAAVEHADYAMRRFFWRGFRPKNVSFQKELMVSDKTAKDFVGEALKRLCEGRRTYNSKRSLLENLNSIADSLISADKKASDRAGIKDFEIDPEKGEQLCNPMSVLVCSEPAADEAIIAREQAAFQTACYKEIRDSFDGDAQTQDYLDALSEGFDGIEDISQVTGIPVEKIYEIRRKLKKRIPDIFGISKYAELERQ